MSSRSAARASLIKYSVAADVSKLPPPSSVFNPNNPIETPMQDASLQEILCALIPPRAWVVDGSSVVDVPSCAAATRADTLELEARLQESILSGHARNQPLCSIREQLYRECFDELIRQITVECPSRGLFLGRIRNEMYRTISLYEAMYNEALAGNGGNASRAS